MVMAAGVVFLCSHPPKPKPPQNPIDHSSSSSSSSRRQLILNSASLCVLSLTLQQSTNIPICNAQTSTSTSNSILNGIANTKSWFQYFGSGFAIRVPPNFEDMTDPEDYSAGLSLYGDKAKTKTYAARFASPDGSEVLSVVIRPSNQLKITFLEAQDIADIGSLKEAAKLFVPGGATLYSARTIKIKEDEGFRTYYFYEFGTEEVHFALVAAVNSGKAFIAGAAAPRSKWDDDGVKLRSAAVSLTLL